MRWGRPTTPTQLKAQLLAAVPPAALAANPNIVPGADIQNIWDAGAWTGGPIIKNKLWYSLSYHHQGLDQYLLGNYDSDGSQVLDDNLMWTVASKISWQINPTTQLSYFYNVQYKKIGHRNGGGLFADSAARNLSEKYPQINQVKFTKPLSSHMVVDVSGSSIRTSDNFRPQPEVSPTAISHFDSVTNTYTVALPNYHDNPEVRAVFMGSLDYVVRDHDLKVGYQYMRESSGFPILVDVRHACGVPQRCSRFGEYLQHTEQLDPVRFDARRLLRRSVAAGAAPDAEPGAAVRNQLRMAAGHLSAGDAVRARGSALMRSRARRTGRPGRRACRLSTT